MTDLTPRPTPRQWTPQTCGSYGALTSNPATLNAIDGPWPDPDKYGPTWRDE